MDHDNWGRVRQHFDWWFNQMLLIERFRPHCHLLPVSVWVRVVKSLINLQSKCRKYRWHRQRAQNVPLTMVWLCACYSGHIVSRVWERERERQRMTIHRVYTQLSRAQSKCPHVQTCCERGRKRRRDTMNANGTIKKHCYVNDCVKLLPSSILTIEKQSNE